MLYILALKFQHQILRLHLNLGPLRPGFWRHLYP